MSIRNKYEAELAQVFDKLVTMCRETERAIDRSVEALVRRNPELSRAVIDEDKNIDLLEHEIEQDCLKILLMEHPVASDFRDVSAALKMITDMERIGDQAEDIAEIISFLDGRQAETNALLKEMARAVIRMVTESVDAYVKCDIMLAKQVIAEDDVVDAQFAQVKQSLIGRIAEHPAEGEYALDLLMIAKYYERIGDHATNIAEWVIYSVSGVHKEEITFT